MIAWLRMLCGGLVLAAVVWAVHEIRADGARSVIQAIERQNDDAANRAQEKRLDYDTCIVAGGLWDFGAEKCRGP
ncbi:hypothetical protein LPJGGPFB_02712 [Ensifer adhaerens]|nr:hypothetical protein [Ensifer adhaerens]